MRGRRRVLFLQGMATQFFDALGAGLKARGHEVHRINFNAGDRLFWRNGNGIDFRGKAPEWPDFLGRVVRERGITDLVLFGDCRPLHRAAVALARGIGLPVHVCEEGYIRPDWVTFELGGVNGHSGLPRDPGWYLDAAAGLPALAGGVGAPSSFARRAVEDLVYNLTAIVLGAAYPHYQTHRPQHRLVEYADWSWKVLRSPVRRRRSVRELGRLGQGQPYFVLPLQLDSDTQIRLHSPFAGMRPAIAAVIGSFARHAGQEAMLVVKEHPLDSGGVDWRGIVGGIAAAEGVADRVVHVECADIGALVAGARGVVTVNSTTGTLALARGVPVITLGRAVYDIAGLTDQGGLDGFWGTPGVPDAALFQAFQRVLAARCLLAGSFFSGAGIRMLVAQAVERMEAVPVRHAVRQIEAGVAEAGMAKAGVAEADGFGVLAMPVG